MVTRLRVTILSDNTVYREKLLAEHGLSLLIEADGARVLFDTGQGLAALRNAQELGVSLERLDAVVLSHGHYDHTGGLAEVLRRFSPAAVYLHPAALEAKFSAGAKGPSRAIGMPEESRRALDGFGGRVVWTTSVAEVVPGLWCTGEIPRQRLEDQAIGGLYLDADCTLQDPVFDDQSLYAEHEGGVVAITGCSHSGLGNTLARIGELSGQKRLAAVIGGFHFIGATLGKMESLASVIEERGCRMVAPCHCTGAQGSALLRARFGTKFCEAGVGAQFVLAGGQ